MSERPAVPLSGSPPRTARAARDDAAGWSPRLVWGVQRGHRLRQRQWCCSQSAWEGGWTPTCRQRSARSKHPIVGVQRQDHVGVAEEAVGMTQEAVAFAPVDAGHRLGHAGVALEQQPGAGRRLAFPIAASADAGSPTDRTRIAPRSDRPHLARRGPRAAAGAAVRASHGALPALRSRPVRIDGVGKGTLGRQLPGRNSALAARRPAGD